MSWLKCRMLLCMSVGDNPTNNPVFGLVPSNQVILTPWTNDKTHDISLLVAVHEPCWNLNR